MGARKIKKPAANVAVNYGAFDQLDGEHPWMHAVPNGYVPYSVRELRTGEIAYFNFALAKEMGLLPANHPNKMNEQLKGKLLETFSVQIINEYDEKLGRKFATATIKQKKYMASRYLQLQHTDKKGKTSGDGRGIWNGTLSHAGKTWDVSSRGTGVTCLAPGAVAAKRPLETGGTEFGYGCGLAEIDELYGASLLAEIMHLQGHSTERVLCIVDLGKGFGIGVRAAPNLLRPAHIFLYLKQNRKAELKASLDYFIERQIENGRWKPKSRGTAIYKELAEKISLQFATFAAHLEIDYVFAWLDWDGDNVLVDAGIIDYGSVRQFGLRHDLYRYDDIDRFSTTLNEQRHKARRIVQGFMQIADYLKTGEKQPLRDYANHPISDDFDKHFTKQRAHRLLYRMGFDPAQRESILSKKSLFKKFDKVYSYFEKAKISGSIRKVPDGVNLPPLFNLRSVLRTLPATFRDHGLQHQTSEDEFFRLILSNFAKPKDKRKRSKHSRQIQSFQRFYCHIMKVAVGRGPAKATLQAIADRATKLNNDERITGNALIQIVEEIIRQRASGATHETVQSWIDQLILSHLDFPEVANGNWYPRGPRAIPSSDVLEKLLDLVQSYKHDI